MALTATATKRDQLAISCTIGLRNPFVLTKCPTSLNFDLLSQSIHKCGQVVEVICIEVEEREKIIPQDHHIWQDVCHVLQHFFQ